MFVLRISVTAPAVDRIKALLTQSLPEVKSSHRVEALGRGLGFRTYAALRAAAQTTAPAVVAVAGSHFSDYLKDHGFEADPAHLYRAAAHVAIQAALDALPRLHSTALASDGRNGTSMARGKRQTSNMRNSRSAARNVSASTPLRPSCGLLHCWHGSEKPGPSDRARAVTVSSISPRTTFALIPKAESSDRLTFPMVCSLPRLCIWASGIRPMSTTLAMTR